MMQKPRPPGVEGTLFALLMSLFNGAGILGTELGALLTSMLGVSTSSDSSGSNFSNLWLLVTICNLTSLLPLFAVGWLDAVPAPVGDSENETSGPTALAGAPDTMADAASTGD